MVKLSCGVAYKQQWNGMNLHHDEAVLSDIPIILATEALPPQVLVVDDTMEIRYCLAAFLRAKGYRVLEAENGLAAQMILTAEHPSLVISDLEMPISNGWDVITYCHTHCPEIPVMILSGALGKRPEIESWAAGSLIKPFSLPCLRAEVERLIDLAA